MEQPRISSAGLNAAWPARVAWLALMIALSGCGNGVGERSEGQGEQPPPAGSGAGVAGMGANDPTAGTGAMAGSGGTGGGAPPTNGNQTLAEKYPDSSIMLCPDAALVSLPIDSFALCDMHACTGAHCVPQEAIPESVPLELLAACDDPTTFCVPDDYTDTFGEFLAKSCTSILGAEGRCISTCVPQVNGLMDALPAADCGPNERCAPCINPNDGLETGACSQGCDPGPSQETLNNPILFAKCANGGGACVPKDIIPPVFLNQLIQMDCASPDEVCSPIEKSQNLKYNFPSCTPSDPFVGVLAEAGPNGQMGGCVPAWLADANLLEGLFLHQDSCEAGRKCAPCHNPLRLGAPTGACPVPLPSDPSGGFPPDDGFQSRGPH